MLARFEEGLAAETSDLTSAPAFLEQFGDLPGLAKLLERLGIEEESPGAAASAVEFAMEGLHLSKRLNKDEAGRLGAYRYEAFDTSGGLGTLCDTLDGRVRELNYKTIRYVGHCTPVRLLVNELRLSECRKVLKDILEGEVPVTFQDVVVTFCTVVGWRNGQLVQITDGRKVYHHDIGGQHWSAIQITTAAGICAVLDLFVAGKLPRRGFVRQEQVDLDAFLANRFGRHYDSPTSARLHDEWPRGEDAEPTRP